MKTFSHDRGYKLNPGFYKIARLGPIHSPMTAYHVFGVGSIVEVMATLPCEFMGDGDCKDCAGRLRVNGTEYCFSWDYGRDRHELFMPFIQEPVITSDQLREIWRDVSRDLSQREGPQGR